MMLSTVRDTFARHTYLCSLAATALLLASTPARSQQAETTALCDEDGVPPIAEPVPMNYGDHTEGCLIDPATETDSFRFEGQTGDNIRINLLGQTGNFGPSIEVRDPLGGSILTESCQPPFNSICSLSGEQTLVMNGTYLISITDVGANNIGAYTLQLERLFPDGGEERLDYDSVLDEDMLPTDVTAVVDNIDPATDVDQFFFHGLVGTTVRLNVLGQTGNFGPSIVIRDPVGNVVIDGSADGAECQPPFNSICSFQVDYDPLMTGEYSLLILDRGFNNLGAYQLSLWCVVGDCDNDGDTTADVRRTTLRYGEAVTSKTIDPAVDVEMFRFMATPGDEISFTVLGLTGNFGPRIEMRDPVGMLTTLSPFECQPPFNSICSFTTGSIMPTMMGEHTLILYDRGINNIGAFQLNLNCVFSPGDFACENLQGQFPGDVPEDYWAHAFIEILADYKITVGCGGNNYCPDDSVTREQMAVFIERGINGGDYVPPAATCNVFTDVSCSSFAIDFIEQFFADGITSGCGPGTYCPDDSVTRAQMAVFLLRGKFGANHVPPAPTGVFNDVPTDHWAAAWIEQLFDEGITAGCGNDNYCPDDPVTRAQMAVFIVRTFELGN